MLITAKELREKYVYNPEDGLFTRRYSENGWKMGMVAGSKADDGYVRIRINAVSYFAHRLAWLYMKNEWPANQIDHISGVKSDNRWENLREATKGQNLQNQKRPQGNNTTGFLGVTKNGKGFQAQISFNSKQTYLGTFNSPEEAHAAYLAAKRKLHSFNML